MALDVGVGLRAWQARTRCVPADLGVDEVSYAHTIATHSYLCFNLVSTNQTGDVHVLQVVVSVTLRSRHARKHAALLGLGLVGQRLALELVRLPVRVLTRGVAIVHDATPFALGVRAHRRFDGRARGARARRESGLDRDEE